MLSILIIDYDSIRAGTIADQISIALPEIDIYWYDPKKENDKEYGDTYKCDFYEDGLFNFNDTIALPITTVTLALCHYGNSPDIPNVKINTIVGFGGGGRENHPSILHHIVPKLGTNEEVLKILNLEDTRKFWEWAIAPIQLEINAPAFLLSESNQSALIALQILCQGYLTIYSDLKSPFIDINIITKQQCRVNSQEWWIAPFGTVSDLQKLFVDHTNSTVANQNYFNLVIRELIGAIQCTDKWAAIKPKLKEVCKQCLNE